MKKIQFEDYSKQYIIYNDPNDKSHYMGKSEFSENKPDQSFAIYKMNADCIGKDDLNFVFENKRYHFFPENASEAVYCVSNNGPSGFKRIALYLKNMKNVVVDGNGASFVMHGHMMPVIIDNCENVKIRNMNISWENSMMMQAKVLDCQAGYIDLEPENHDFFKIQNNKIYMTGHGFSEPLPQGWFSLLEMDKDMGGPAYMAGDDSLGISPNALNASYLPDGNIRLKGDIKRYPAIGNYLIFRISDGKERPSNAILITESKDVGLENVHVYSAIGMGIVAQKSRNVTLDRTCIMPDPNSKKIYSLYADATHFVNCSGRILVKDCVFTGQMDDAVNVHGNYMQVFRVLDKHNLVVIFSHEQQKGVQIFNQNDRIRLLKSLDMSFAQENDIENVEVMNGQRCIITLKDEIPEDFGEKDIVENISDSLIVTIEGCKAYNNRPRGFLVSAGEKVIIRNNYLHTPGAGIQIAGDGNDWFESGQVSDVLIENNVFDNCAYISLDNWCKHAIYIWPEGRDPAVAPKGFHKNIRIVNNTVNTFASTVIRARGVDGITVSGNTINQNRDYEDHSPGAVLFDMEGCDNIEIKNNIINE